MEQTQQLKNYIHQQIESGVSPDEILAQLKGAGWDENIIKSAFGAVQAAVVPTPMQENPQPVSGEAKVEQTYAASGGKRGKIKTSWLLLKQSLNILKTHRSLVRYPLMGIAINFILLSFFLLALFLGRDIFLVIEDNFYGETDINLNLAGYVLGFVYYVSAFFVVFMYSAGLSANVLDIFRGSSKKYNDYMRLAWSKKSTIFMYSIINTTVGFILRAIEQRFKLLGFIISRVLGVLWALANLFTIPVIVENEISAPQAIKKSSKLFLSRWGENVTARVTFGFLFFLIYLVIALPLFFFLAIFVGLLFSGFASLVAVLTVFVIFVLFFATVESAAEQILSTALYYYAQYNQVPATFSPELLNNSLVPKKKKKGLFKKS